MLGDSYLSCHQTVYRALSVVAHLLQRLWQRCRTDRSLQRGLRHHRNTQSAGFGRLGKRQCTSSIATSAHHLCWSRHFIRPNSRTGTKTATPQPPTPLSCVPHSHTSFHHSSRPAHRFPRSCKSHRLIPHHPIADSCPESRLYSISLLRNTLSQQIGTGR